MAAADGCSLVLVTGATGYIASHIIQQLLHVGYNVRGTVRDLSKQDKLKPIKDLSQDESNKVELVQADLANAESWETVTEGCSHVIHTASPFPNQNPSDEDEVIKPAVDGTLAILKACHKARVQRVVLTSSVVSIIGGLVGADASKIYSEEDWTEVENLNNAYAKSKILAEKAAWDFVKELPEGEKFELAVINPAFCMGPTLGKTLSTSLELPKKLLERAMPAVPKIYMPIADVRDVAAAHVTALTSADAAGHRHIIMTQGMWIKDLAHIMHKEFKPQGYSVPTMNCPYFAVWVKSLFDKTLKMTLPMIGKSAKLDNTRMKDVLRVSPHNIDETVLDMCYSLIENGLVKKSKKYHGPKREGEETQVEGETEANGTVINGQGSKEDNEEEGKNNVNGDAAEETEEKTELTTEEKTEGSKEEKSQEVKETASPAEMNGDVRDEDEQEKETASPAEMNDGVRDEDEQEKETASPAEMNGDVRDEDEQEKEATPEKHCSEGVVLNGSSDAAVTEAAAIVEAAAVKVKAPDVIVDETPAEAAAASATTEELQAEK